MTKRITVVGSSNVDMIMQVPRLPRVGETVTNGRFLQTYGGKGANQAVAAARAGGQVTFVTCLGDDLFAREIVVNLKRDGIQTDHVLIKKGVPTGTCLIMFDSDGANYLAADPGANFALEVADVEHCSDLIASSAMLVIQMEIANATTQKLLDLAAAHAVKALVNFAPLQTTLLPVSSLMHGLIVNETEAELLTGLTVETPQQARLAAHALRSKGPAFVLLTLGAKGAWAASSDVDELVPAFEASAVDTTAAGDTFCGALAVALVEGSELVDAVKFAGAAAAIAVTRIGAQPSIPTRKEIDQFRLENQTH